jgi:hypothetical protein
MVLDAAERAAFGVVIGARGYYLSIATIALMRFAELA